MIRKMFAASIALAMFGLCQPALANEATSDGFPRAQNFSVNHVPGSDQDLDGTTAPSGFGSTYLFVAGSAFTPRRSAQMVTYPGGGCSYSTDALTTSLELPDFAEIYGVRVYYYSTNESDNVGLFLTNYPGDGTSDDLLTGTSSFSSGYSDEYFEADPALTVDNLSGSYVLTATMDAGTRFCGMRVFYTP